MNKYRNYQFYNFKGGVDFKNSPPLIAQSEKEVAWANAHNVELLQNGGIVQMNGTQLFAELPNDEADEIIGGYQGDNNGTKYLVIVTNNGKFYYYNNGQFVLCKDNLTKGIKPNFKVYLNGLFVSNGVDEPFLFMPNSEEKILPVNAITSSGHSIKGNAIEVYKGRIWIADGSTLYYSALGKFNDWVSENDAGSVSNFHNDTSSISALCCYKDALVIHKEDASFLLTGNSPENFSIHPLEGVHKFIKSVKMRKRI